MTARILSVGDDEDLLSTRLAVLQTRWSAKSTDCAGALKFLQSEAFDLLLLCHSIPEEEAKSLVQAVRKNFPAARILALETSPGSANSLGACATAVTAHGPSSMLDKIAALLAG